MICLNVWLVLWIIFCWNFKLYHENAFKCSLRRAIWTVQNYHFIVIFYSCCCSRLDFFDLFRFWHFDLLKRYLTTLFLTLEKLNQRPRWQSGLYWEQTPSTLFCCEWIDVNGSFRGLSSRPNPNVSFAIFALGMFMALKSDGPNDLEFEVSRFCKIYRPKGEHKSMVKNFP